MALAAFSQPQSQEKLLNKLRSAALLCPIADLAHTTSPIVKAAVDLFLAEVKFSLSLSQ